MKVSTWKRFLPKSIGDWLAMFMCMTAIHAVPIFEIVVILPYIDAEKRGTYWLHIAGGAYIYINIMVCFVMTVITDTTSGSLVLPSILKPGWRFCSVCEANAPPRSLHCYFCDMCILQRDHHCMFTGNCVGHANQRYFFIMVMHFCLAALYCNYLNMDYTWEIIGTINLKALFTMIVPLFAWMLGVTETYTFGVAFISSMCVIAFFMTGALTCYHLMNVYAGQTTQERSLKNKTYDLGWKENFRAVFGARWYIAWISPFIPSPLPGNGIEFQTRRAFENVKDL